MINEIKLPEITNKKGLRIVMKKEKLHVRNVNFVLI